MRPRGTPAVTRPSSPSTTKAGTSYSLADTTDTLERLHARRPDAITSDPDAQIQTIDRIVAHAAEHPTIYLPTHDPDAVARLEAGTTL